MAHIIADRILETSTTTGTGALTLAGAVTGYRAFSAVCTSPSDTVNYYIEGVDGSGIPTGEWETGLGTYSAANTLTRTTPNAGSAATPVSFSAGTKRVSIAWTALDGKQEIKGADIASAGTCDIGAATGGFVHITGTTTITGLGTIRSGVMRHVTFDGILTLTHNATSLILPGAANITTAAGDSAIFRSEGSGNWRCVSYSKASGTAVVAAAMVLLSTATPSGAGTVSFTSISGSYRHLKIIGTGRDTTSGTGTITLTGQLNSDTGANYNYQRLTSQSTTTSSARSTGQTAFICGEIPKAGDVASVPGMFEILISNYSDTNLKKSFQVVYSMITDATTGLYIISEGGYWNSTSAITRIDVIGGTFDSGSVISLYGLA